MPCQVKQRQRKTYIDIYMCYNQSLANQTTPKTKPNHTSYFFLTKQARGKKQKPQSLSGDIYVGVRDAFFTPAVTRRAYEASLGVELLPIQVEPGFQLYGKTSHRESGRLAKGAHLPLRRRKVSDSLRFWPLPQLDQEPAADERATHTSQEGSVSTRFPLSRRKHPRATDAAPRTDSAEAKPASDEKESAWELRRCSKQHTGRLLCSYTLATHFPR